MYLKNLLFACLMLGALNTTTAQELDEEKTLHHEDTTGTKHSDHSFTFGKEKPGTVCVNGLEKLELAVGTDRAFSEVMQIHFYGPSFTSGRVFAAATQEKNTHFVDMSIDATAYEFPVHLSYSFGLDQIGHKPNVSYTGPGGSIYFSDMLFFHKYFHILRAGMSYDKMTEHAQTVNLGIDGSREDSSFVKGYAWETVVFYQIQPYHITHNMTLFSEGLFKSRESNNFMEFELGVRHAKVLDEMVGIGMRMSYENMHFHKISVILRFSLSSPNPKHLGLREKRWKF